MTPTGTRRAATVLAALLLAAPAWALDDDDPRVTPVVRAYRKARPAVVNISAEQLVTPGFGFPGFGEDPFAEIFPMPYARRVPVKSLGSGVIIHPDGYIVTNAHVVRRAQAIQVTLSSGKDREAKVISADPAHDLAVLRITAPAGGPLPYLPLGRSDDLLVGETVIAIGNPLGYANTLTTGVISALDRTLEFGGGVKYAGLIQIDAPINPGNSGGPLLNIKGELIGINTAIRADAQNIGFAIPVDALAEELASLLDFERMNRVVFGATVVQRHGQAGDEVVVKAVAPGTPAAKRLRAGDRIVALDGRPVRQITDFTCAMLTAKGGQVVRLTCRRGQEEFVAAVQLAVKPKPDGAALARSRLGLMLRPITPQLARDLRLSVGSGLLIVDVEAGGPAARLGLRRRDILFQVDRFYLSDLEQLGQLLEDVEAGGSIRIGILRGNQAVWAPIRLRAAGEPKAAEKPV